MKSLINKLVKFLLRENKLFIEGLVTVIKTDSKTGEVLSVIKQKNRVMLGTDTGKSLILQRLAGINTYSLNITHCDLGTGTNAPADGNTTLQTPVARQPIATASIASNILTLQFFFASVDLPNGSYNEFASFVDGTASVSTGKIFNRALFGSTYTKATGEDTTIQLDFTLN